MATKPLTRSRSAIAGQQSGHPLLVPIAWFATVLLSKLPLVVARELFAVDIPWIAQAWIGAAILLFAITYPWPTLKPLRGYFAVLAIVFLATTVFDPLVAQTAAWRGWFAGTSPLRMLLGERLLVALEATIVVAGLFLLGLKRQAMFVTVGDLTAPVRGISLPGRQQPVTWVAFGVTMAVLSGGLFLFFMLGQHPTALTGLAGALPWLPLAVLCAGLNAFGEEMMYRAAPLAVLLPVVRPVQALWMTSVWFGLGHYYGGIPAGPFGFVQAGLVALLMGKAMLDTRGLGWPWMIHLVLDTIIYIFMAPSL
jgi:membrane protease YdiL (CAAX protease family)